VQGEGHAFNRQLNAHDQGEANLHLHPAAILLAAFDAGGDESHALHTVIDRRIDDGRIDSGSASRGMNGSGSFGIDRRKGFEIAFRMAARG
jgi:hypothetical protein